MNETRTVSYACPYCGKTFDIEVYDSIDAQDEDLRQRALSGDLFLHSCPHCKKDFMVQNPLLYIDREHHFVLWLSQQEANASIQKFTAPLSKAGYILRRCETVKEFCEKIQILEDGVDDRLVELCKYDCFIEFIDNKKGNAEDITSIEYQKTDNGVMKINIRTDDKGMAFITPISMVEEEMAQNPALFEVDNQSIPLVNSKWITELYQPNNNKESKGILS